ncbi:MAG TPA: GTP cyclohydrolase MptA [Thermoplasmata archaeon]|jgi:GTP cyclohydrolase-4|nr:GTP cyclohydrolase MptA [Thermoplasmata archaeon]
MRDVHALAPTHDRLRLSRVGVTAVKKPLVVQRPGRQVSLSVSFSVAVDLPSTRKGSDLSRNAELLAEVVDWTAQHPVQSLEAACSAIARELLVRHPYATNSEVLGEAEYFAPRGITPARRSLEDFQLFAEATARRGEQGTITVQRSIGAEAVGMTACPCAMETARAKLEKEFPLLADPSLKALPIVTHNQRNRTRLLFDLSEDAEVEVDAILDAIEGAQSSPTYAILKRGDEADVVLTAHRHPKFVEDVVRDLLASIPSRFASLPDATGVRVRTVSEESIHKYDVTSSHATTLGELRSPAA